MGKSQGRYSDNSRWKQTGALILFVLFGIFSAVVVYRGITNNVTQSIIVGSLGFICCVVLAVLSVKTLNKKSA